MPSIACDDSREEEGFERITRWDAKGEDLLSDGSARDGSEMKILVAMSGGVDSSVAAALLMAAGHEVTGVTMKLWGGESDTGCCSVSDVEDARWAAQHLGVDHLVFNFGDDFKRLVVDPYVADHASGRTPNPCIECNRHLKFDRLLRRAEALGYEAVATGHHARVVERPDGTRRVARGADPTKDQSYVLHMLNQRELAMILLPIGDMTKDDVRAEAKRLGLRTASKPDSQDVCFITSTQGRGGFLSERIEMHPGRIVDAEGRQVGAVESIELVTIGQRKGLALAGSQAPRYVTDVDRSIRTVTVGPREALLVDHVRIHSVSWSDDAFAGPVEVQTSAHGIPVAGVVENVAADTEGSSVDRSGDEAHLDRHDDERIVRWSTPQRRVAPGQSVVLYDGDEVIGGGIAMAPI